MVPESYKNRQGQNMAGIDQSILEEIRGTKAEIGAEIKDLGRDLSAKIDMITKGHNDLRLEVATTHAVMDTKIAKLEKDTTALWDHSRELRREVSGCRQEMETHKAGEQAADKTKKNAGEWVRWVPGVIFGIIAVIISLLGVL